MGLNVVGAAGFEPATPRPPGRRERPEPTRGHRKADVARTDEHEPTQLPGSGAGLGSTVDVVETALATALERAAAAGAWEQVTQLGRELEARRRARANVVELDARRTQSKR